jgi:hypothetical protein
VAAAGVVKAGPCGKGVEAATGRIRSCPKRMTNRPTLRHTCRTWGSQPQRAVGRTLCEARSAAKASLRTYCRRISAPDPGHTPLCRSRPLVGTEFERTAWSICLHQLPHPYEAALACMAGYPITAQFGHVGAGAEIRHCSKTYPLMERRGFRTCNLPALLPEQFSYTLQVTSYLCKLHLNPPLDFTGFCHTSGSYTREIIGFPRTNPLYTFTLPTDLTSVCNTAVTVPADSFSRTAVTCLHGSVEASLAVTLGCHSVLTLASYDTALPHHVCLSYRHEELGLRCKTVPTTSIEPPRWGRTKSAVSRTGFTKVTGRTRGG